MSRFFLFLLAGSIIITSCKFNPNLQGKGEDYLQGVWNQDSIIYKNDLLRYTSHHFQFSCDSFYVTMTTFSKTNIYPDSCYNNGVWTEYAKGIYSSRNDSLFLSGTFTKSNFKQKISGCYRIGQFLETYIVSKTTDERINLQSIKQHLAINLSLKERLVCIQKPIN